MRIALVALALVVGSLALGSALGSAIDAEFQTKHCADIQHAYLEGAYSMIPDSEPISPKISRMYEGMLRACNR